MAPLACCGRSESWCWDPDRGPCYNTPGRRAAGGRLRIPEGLLNKHGNGSGGNGSKGPHYAHASEREFARILDFYQIDWQYEPRTFALRWDDAGTAVESFAPDFYLPELDLFVELTTLRQKLVTKKNRKLRRLRELYPDINIKLFYNRDFKSLMSKYDIRFDVRNEPGSAGDAGELPAEVE